MRPSPTIRGRASQRGPSAGPPNGGRTRGTGGQLASSGRAPLQDLDPNDLLYPCSRQPWRYRTSCYLLQSSAILYLNGRDFAGAAKACDGAPVLMRPWCYSSLGRDASAEAGDDTGEAIELCALGSPRYQPWCYSGAVKDVTFVRGSENDGLEFCRRVRGRANKMGSYRGLGEQLMTLSPAVERRREVCHEAEKSFWDDCSSGAHVLEEPARPSPSVPGA